MYEKKDFPYSIGTISIPLIYYGR